MYLLDSNIVIYFLQQRLDIVNMLFSLQDKIFISSITRFEVEVGASKEPISLAELEKVLDTFHELPFDSQVAKNAVPIFKYFGGKRHMFKDTMIAATAITHNLTLLTADKDFSDIPGLKVRII